MSKRTTSIEWTHHTWNPFVGCSIISQGCENCYAQRLAYRLERMGQPVYKGMVKKTAQGAIWSGKMAQGSHKSRLKPMHIAGNALIFVNSMSDFFHSNVKVLWQEEALQVMEKCPQHIFQILTKRPENIQTYLKAVGRTYFPDNVWVGCTIENFKVKKRIDILRRVKAKIKFLSCEPLLTDLGKLNLKNIQWVITGGESGPNARPFLEYWLHQIHLQCKAQKVPHFFKQYGKGNNNPLYGTPAYLRDTIGKGGSLLRGKYFKEFPSCYKALQGKLL